jgi:hypothetical protein
MDASATIVTKARAQELVERLLAHGLRPEKIAEELDGRVSARTVYRWLSGLHGPQQAGDVRALEALLEKVESSLS